MNLIDTKHLRELAEASLPRGTWVEEDHSDAIIIQGSEGEAHDGRALAVAENVYLAEDRTYIAAIDPPTLITLLDELERLRHWKAEAKLVKVREKAEEWSPVGYRGRTTSGIVARVMCDEIRMILDADAPAAEPIGATS